MLLPSWIMKHLQENNQAQRAPITPQYHLYSFCYSFLIIREANCESNQLKHLLFSIVWYHVIRDTGWTWSLSTDTHSYFVWPTFLWYTFIQQHAKWEDQWEKIVKNYILPSTPGYSFNYSKVWFLHKWCVELMKDIWISCRYIHSSFAWEKILVFPTAK